MVRITLAAALCCSAVIPAVAQTPIPMTIPLSVLSASVAHQIGAAKSAGLAIDNATVGGTAMSSLIGAAATTTMLSSETTRAKIAEAAAVAGAPLKSANLSDLAAPATARANLGAAASGANADITSLSAAATVGVGGAALSTISAAATGALPASGGTMSGNVNLAPGIGVRYSHNSNMTWDGSSNNLSLLQGSPYINGFGNFARPLGDFSVAEGIKDIGDTDFLWLYDRMTDGGSGNRNVIQTTLDVAGVPGTADTLIGLASHTLMESHQPTLAGSGWPVGPSTTSGSMQGIWSNNIIQYTTPGLQGAYGEEVDLSSTYPSTLVPEYLGLAVVNQSPQAPANGWGLPRYGSAVQAGIDVQGQWGTMYAVGKPTGDWAGTVNSTILKVFQREYSGVPAPGSFVARDGIDLRGVSFGGSAYTSSGFGVSPTGAVDSTVLETGGAVQAATATVSGATIVEGGLYEIWPSLTVEAPPLGGTTATATVTTLGLLGVDRFISTGRNYHVGSQLTPTGVTLPPDGIAPVFTVSSVDANGGITGGSWTTLGNATDHQIQQVTAMTGGGGTGAMFVIDWQIVVPSGAVTAWSVQPTDWTPAATGSGFAVGDPFGPSGDAGTPGKLTVAAVSSDGGIMMPPSGFWTVASAGAATSISADGPTATSTSGSGTGANLVYGYTVTGVGTTPGSGYLPDVQPVVTASQSPSWDALIRPSLSRVQASLSLNGITAEGEGAVGPVSVSGGNIYNITGSPIPLACAVSAPTTPNAIPATCHVAAATSLGTNTQGSQGTGYAANTFYYVVDSYGDIVGAVQTGGSVGSNGQITSIAGLGGSNTAFPLHNGALPAGPYTVNGGNHDATFTSVNFSPSSVAIDDPGSGFAAQPTVTVSSTTGYISSATGTAAIAPVQRTAGSSFTTGNETTLGQHCLDSACAMWMQETGGKVVIGAGATRLLSIGADGTPTFLKAPVVGTP